MNGANVRVWYDKTEGYEDSFLYEQADGRLCPVSREAVITYTWGTYLSAINNGGVGDYPQDKGKFAGFITPDYEWVPVYGAGERTEAITDDSYPTPQGHSSVPQEPIQAVSELVEFDIEHLSWPELIAAARQQLTREWEETRQKDPKGFQLVYRSLKGE